jgi:hypothetical protein
MGDYCAFLANCLASGDEISKREDGSWVRDTIRWQLDGHDVVLKQNDEVVVKNAGDFRNQWVDTSRLIIKDVEENKVASAERIAVGVTAILTFGGMSPVRFFGYEYPQGSGKTSVLSTVGQAGYFRPTIEIRNGAAVKEFVDACWPAYKKHRADRKIAEMFEYLTTAESATAPMEVKLVIMFVLLEALKDTYARSHSIPYAKGYYRKVSSPPKSNLAKEPRYSFEELLTKMLAAVKIRKGLKRIIALRNQLVHSGLTRNPFRSQWKTYCNIHDIVRLYFLRLLGYSGAYFPYSTPNQMKRV